MAMRSNGSWIQDKGNELVDAILLPPMQILAATINFLILLLTNQHMFELPFHGISDIKPTKELLDILPLKRKPETMKKKMEFRDDTLLT
jgi:hypothetical protein